MILHNIEECQKWIVRTPYSPFFINMPLFKVEPDEINEYYLTYHIADIEGKSFQHNENRIIDNINKIIYNYPQLKSVVEKLHIFMCPKPSADTSNACASTNYICFFARSTQIPHCMTDYITGHELGHCIEYKLCLSNKFKEYLELRNAPKSMCHIYIKWDKEKNEDIYDDKEDFIYLNGTPEEKRLYHGEWDTHPQEWFAEDFRYLFGVDQGEKYWGLPIEPPNEKIKEFFLSLQEEWYIMINKNIKRTESNTKATLSFEGLESSKFATKIGEYYLRGLLSGEEALRLIKKQHIN